MNMGVGGGVNIHKTSHNRFVFQRKTKKEIEWRGSITVVHAAALRFRLSVRPPPTFVVRLNEEAWLPSALFASKQTEVIFHLLYFPPTFGEMLIYCVNVTINELTESLICKFIHFKQNKQKNKK